MSNDAFWKFERDGWERAAASYESCWTDTSLFLNPLLDAAGVRTGTRVLDVACGPGYVSEAAIARGAEPTGLDVAARMLELARLRCPGRTFVEGDAQRLPFGDATFDAVTMNFGILHLSRPDDAIAEARRVLAPGGRFSFTAWVAEGSAPDEIVDAALAAHAVPVQVPEGPPVYRFAEPDVCRLALEHAGFDAGTIGSSTVTVAWQVPDADALFTGHLEAGVRTAAVLRAQPPEQLDAIRAAMAAGVRRHAAGAGGFVLPITARVASGQVPRADHGSPPG